MYKNKTISYPHILYFDNYLVGFKEECFVFNKSRYFISCMEYPTRNKVIKNKKGIHYVQMIIHSYKLHTHTGAQYK